MMFVVTATEAAAIRTAWITGGELSAAVEVRRLFPGIEDRADALACARTIASWRETSPATPPPPRRDR
jgi:hypothetical protein